MSKFQETVGDTYKVIRGYLSRETALQLADTMRASKDVIVEDDPNRKGFFNLTEMSAIAAEKVSFLNDFIGGPKLLPTYTYGRIYNNKSDLCKHTDRGACEVSLSIHLDGDAESKFYIENKDGKEVSIDLDPGDAVLYDGPNAVHWRDEYCGEEYIQTFHHYVFLGGECESEFQNKTGNLNDYIKVYRGMVPRKVCEEIVDVITSDEYSRRWKRAEIVSDERCIDDHRLCDDLKLTTNDPIDSTVNKYVRKALFEFCREFTYLTLAKDEGYYCLRYYPGGKYDYHTDQYSEFNREITLIIQLNGDYEGGALRHCDDKYITNLNVGDICIFPSNYMFPHKIEKITSGVRYAIVTWAV